MFDVTSSDWHKWDLAREPNHLWVLTKQANDSWHAYFATRTLPCSAGYKRRAHANANQLFVIGVEPSANLFPDEFAESPDSARPSISFGEPADDRMSIAASEDELVSGNEDSALRCLRQEERRCPSQIQSWLLCFPGPPRASGCTGLLLLLNARGWTIGSWGAGRSPAAACSSIPRRWVTDQSWTCAFWTGPFTSSRSGC